jgi:hypothetical protein
MAMMTISWLKNVTVLASSLALAGSIAVGAQENSLRKTAGNCSPGLHSSPTGPFAVVIYCEDVLGDYLAVIHAAPIGAPVDEGGKWSLENRYWFDQLWASDITGFKWSSDGHELFVSTSGIYGSGGLFKLDLFKRKATQLLPKGKPVSVNKPGPGYSIEGKPLEP